MVCGWRPRCRQHAIDGRLRRTRCVNGGGRRPRLAGRFSLSHKSELFGRVSWRPAVPRNMVYGKLLGRPSFTQSRGWCPQSRPGPGMQRSMIGGAAGVILKKSRTGRSRASQAHTAANNEVDRKSSLAESSRALTLNHAGISSLLRCYAPPQCDSQDFYHVVTRTYMQRSVPFTHLLVQSIADQTNSWGTMSCGRQADQLAVQHQLSNCHGQRGTQLHLIEV